MSEEKKEEKNKGEGIGGINTSKGGINEKPSASRPAPPKGQGAPSQEKPKAPPKPKMCPLMGPGTHPCRPECSWAWVSPENKSCVCSVSILVAIARDVAGPIRELFTPKIMTTPQAPGKGPDGIINLSDLKKGG